MPSRVAWQLAADQRAFKKLFRTSPFGSSPSHQTAIENSASHCGWLAREAKRTRSSDSRWAACGPGSLFAQASGWQRSGKRCELCGCHDRAALSCRSAAGFRRRALFWKIDASHSRLNMIDSPVANIASSGLLRIQSSQTGDEAYIDDLPTGLAVSRGPTLVQRTSLAAKAGVAWADAFCSPRCGLSRTAAKLLKKHRRARPEKWPDRLCGNHPAYRSAPRKLGLPRWPLARPASAVTSEF